MQHGNVGFDRELPLEAQIRQRERGEHFTSQLGRVGNCRGPAQCVQGLDALAQFTAEDRGAGLFEQGGVKLTLGFPLRGLGALAQQGFLRAAPGLSASAFRGLLFPFIRVRLLVLHEPERTGGEGQAGAGRDGKVFEARKCSLDVARPAETAAGEEKIEFRLQLRCGGVALFRLWSAGTRHHLVQLQERFALGQAGDAHRQLRKLHAIAARGQFVK